MPSRRKNWIGRALVAVLIALAGHAVVIALFVTFWGDLPAALSNSARTVTAQPTSTATDDDRPMEIETLVDQLDRPEQKSAEELRREEAAKKEEQDKNPNGQVVDIAKPAIEERPDRANYVSEYDSKVDRETKGATARDRAGGKEAPDHASQPTPPSAKAEPAPGSPQAKPGIPGPLAMRELEQRRAREEGQKGTIDEARERDGEMPRPGQRSEPAPEAARPQQPPGQGGNGLPPGEGGKQGGKLNLQPNVEALQQAIGRGNGSMDYLKDVDDGESTALNSKKWAHAAFFNRVKRQVADQWHPDVVYVQHDPHGNVYGVKDRVTVLRVHLKPDGHLDKWTMMQSSGVDFLDDEAIHAFQKAQPFPNPPHALVESDGQIHFNFAFIFELSGRTNFKVFKY